MTETEILRQIVQKMEELIDLYLSYVVIDNDRDREIDNQLIRELAELRQQLEQAEVEEIKNTPAPTGWICPRCQKVHSWLSMTCDCQPIGTWSTTYKTE